MAEIPLPRLRWHRSPLRSVALAIATALVLTWGGAWELWAIDGPCASTVAITCGATLPGAIAASGQVRCYQFSAVAGEAVSVTTTETSDSLNACWDLVDANGVSVAHSCGQATTVLPAAGSYVVRVFDNGGNGTGGYNVDFTVVSDAGNCADTIACDASFSRALALAENATFRFSAPADDTVTITTAASTGGTFNPCWELRAADGTVIDRQCGTHVEAVHGGDAYILRIFDNGSDQAGSYALSFDCAGQSGPPPTVTPTPTPTPTRPPSIVDPTAAKQAEKCAGSLAKSSLTFVTHKLGQLAKCTAGISKCVLRSPGDTACLQKASMRCTAGLDQVAALKQAFIASVGKVCAPVALDDLLGAQGLGFATLNGSCTDEFGVPVVDDSSVIACVLGEHTCRSDALLEMEVPRAGELFRVADLGARRASGFSCLNDPGVSGGSLPDPRLGGDVLKCQKGIQTAAARFGATALGNLQQCVNGAFLCVQSAPDEVTCRQKAALRCAKRLAGTQHAEQTLIAAVAKACPDVVYEAARAAGGLGLDAASAACAAYGVATLTDAGDYATCVAEQHRCRLAEMVRYEFPRATELLQTLAPLVSPSDGPCPDVAGGPTPVPGSPTPTPAPTATPGCGDGIVQPGEECDMGPANSNTMPDACRTNCKLANCGDGVIDSFEDCEGRNLDQESCRTLGYDSGTLRCDGDCFFDDSGCRDSSN